MLLLKKNFNPIPQVIHLQQIEGVRRWSAVIDGQHGKRLATVSKAGTSHTL